MNNIEQAISFARQEYTRQGLGALYQKDFEEALLPALSQAAEIYRADTLRWSGDPKTDLLAALLWSQKLLNDYQRHQLPDEVFYHTIDDIGRWASEYWSYSGKIGLAESAWLTNHLTLRLFQLGRLQFCMEPADFSAPVFLPDAMRQYDAARPQETMGVLVPEQIPELGHKMAASRRFSDLTLCAYVSRTDEETQTQFSALTILLSDKTAYIAFRGTDDTIVGWKEDFNLAFLPVVPAQKMAAEYLSAAAAALPSHPLRVGGHSKGGNLAVYSAVFCGEAVQNQLMRVYNNDGPGFRTSLLGLPEHRRVADKITTILPESSVVGMLLEHEERYEVVRSTQSGLWQHDGFSWQVRGERFEHLPDLTEGGISLDMTWFRDNGRDYVMWSDRKIHYGADDEHFEAGTADVYIATVDPKKPWQLTSEPHCVVRPMYGWDRYETPVDEGPYLLRRGDDLFVTISGSSTSMGDLYDVGLLHAKSGADLLQEESWTWLSYPLLTKESVPGEYGPGHNNFIKDPDTGDDLMIYHAIPHDENDKTLFRQPGIRRVHWAKNGLPYLEMTPERDLPEGSENVVMELVVE